MSKRTSPDMKYKCTSDCRQMGCPGHSVRAIHDLSTDMYIFEFEDKDRLVFDENEFHAMEDALETMRDTKEE